MPFWTEVLRAYRSPFDLMHCNCHHDHPFTVKTDSTVKLELIAREAISKTQTECEIKSEDFPVEKSQKIEIGEQNILELRAPKRRFVELPEELEQSDLFNQLIIASLGKKLDVLTELLKTISNDYLIKYRSGCINLSKPEAEKEIINKLIFEEIKKRAL